MYTSETYIKMCDCEEVQEKQPYGKDAINSFFHRIEMMYIESQTIWLPRQDQIQEMMRKHYASQTEENKGDAWFPEGTVALTYVLKNFCKWVCENRSHGERTKSFEELWLGFYMWEKYQYFWSHDEKWMKSQLSV